MIEKLIEKITDLLDRGVNDDEFNNSVEKFIIKMTSNESEILQGKLKEKIGELSDRPNHNDILLYSKLRKCEEILWLRRVNGIGFE